MILINIFFIQINNKHAKKFTVPSLLISTNIIIVDCLVLNKKKIRHTFLVPGPQMSGPNIIS